MSPEQRMVLQDMLAVSTAMRKVARILWSLHAMFEEARDQGSGLPEPGTSWMRLPSHHLLSDGWLFDAP